MILVSRRLFHTSRISFGRWRAAEDALLLSRYKELGPVWTLLSLDIKSRSPVECRRRWLTISGTLEGLGEYERKMVYEEGYEMHNGKLIKIPSEQIVSGPFQRLAASVERVGFKSQRRKDGWGTMERLAVREGFEQYGPVWKLIASKLQYRTPIQCRNMMFRRYIDFQKNLLSTPKESNNEDTSTNNIITNVKTSDEIEIKRNNE